MESSDEAATNPPDTNVPRGRGLGREELFVLAGIAACAAFYLGPRGLLLVPLVGAFIVGHRRADGRGVLVWCTGYVLLLTPLMQWRVDLVDDPALVGTIAAVLLCSTEVIGRVRLSDRALAVIVWTIVIAVLTVGMFPTYRTAGTRPDPRRWHGWPWNDVPPPAPPSGRPLDGPVLVNR
jgi:hypothetical protein